MIVLALLLGVAGVAAGTRLAAAAFVAAAALGALDGGAFAPVVTWTAALAAAMVLLRPGKLRPHAAAMLGSAAVVAAALVDNGAVMLGLWAVASASIALGTDRTDPEAVRRSVVLCALDVLVLVAVAMAASRGFEGWPLTLRPAGAMVLLASAALRAPLASGAALLVVRSQCLVLMTLALVGGGASGAGVADAALVLGAVGFAAGGLSDDPEHMDVIQELALFAVAIGMTGPSRGWTWGALAAGTLIHQLRLMVGRGSAGQWVSAVLRAGAIGLPFLPAIAASMQASIAARGWRSAVVGLGLAAGVATRLTASTGPTRRITRTRRRSVPDDIRSAAVVAAAVVASLWSSAMSLPVRVASPAIPWPGVWAIVGVVVCGIAGAFLPAAVPVRGPAGGQRSLPWRSSVDAAAAMRRLPSSVVVMWGAVMVVVLGAVGLWVVGLTRGFL